MTLLATLNALAPGDAEIALEPSPYAAFLQLFAHRDAQGLVLRMAYHAELIGAPMPPRLHGGSVGGLMEITGTLAVALAHRGVADGGSPYPRPITITIDYLRAGGVHDVFARAHVLRIGRSIANVRTQAWQEDASQVIASAHMNLMVG